MPKFTDKTLLAVRQISIVEVAQRYTSLKKAGADFVGLSPFTKEKTPSFHVYVGSNRFNCFSRDFGGGTIDLTMECEGLSFTEAVEVLARRHNIALEYDGGSSGGIERSSRSDLFRIHEIATAYFREQFAANAVVQEYWTTNRGFKVETAAEFEIGFAPVDDEGELARRVMAADFSPVALRECGLFFCPKQVIKSPNQLLPRFTGRLMIPIHDPQGRVCAFAGRQVPGFQDRIESLKEAKYVNSPETPIFVKGRTVFNLHRARAALRLSSADERFCVVEGQLDVIRLWENGRKLAVGFQGTAVTVEHLAQISRYSNGARCLMDGDAAGAKAAARMIPLVLETETDMVFTPLPVGQDPDSLFKGISPPEVEARFRVLLGRSLTPMAMAVDFHMPKPPVRGGLTAQAKAKIVKQILELLAASPSPTVIWYGTEEVAKILRIDHVAIWYEFLRIRGVDPVPPAPAAPSTVSAPSPAPGSPAA